MSWAQIFVKHGGDVAEEAMRCAQLLAMFQSGINDRDGKPLVKEDGTVEIRNHGCGIGLSCTKDYLEDEGFEIVQILEHD